MAFSEIELKRIERDIEAFMAKRRPPPHLRSQLDLSHRVVGQSVELFEIRPRWNAPQDLIEQSVAKTTFVKTKRLWKVYWMRADLRWHIYQPLPSVRSFEAFLTEVHQDPYHCFFG